MVWFSTWPKFPFFKAILETAPPAPVVSPQCKKIIARGSLKVITPATVSMTTIFRVMDREDLDRNFGFLVHDVSRLMRVAFDRRGRELGLTRSQWWVLTALYAMDGVPQSELADYMDVEKATLGRLIDRLEEKGWVERRPDAIDRRVKRLFLTARVQSLMRALRAVAADLRHGALAGLTTEEHEAFVNALLKVKGNLLVMTDSIDEAADD